MTKIQGQTQKRQGNLILQWTKRQCKLQAKTRAKFQGKPKLQRKIQPKLQFKIPPTTQGINQDNFK